MSKLELVASLFLGYLTFLVIFIRLGFFVGITINNLTLILSFLIYVLSLSFIFSIIKVTKQIRIKNYVALLLFSITSFLYVGGSYFLGNTYDTSWDGQGYHQSAVIALSNNWNPATNPNIDFHHELPSQIFAEGYPSALWEIEASIYSLTGKINSSKIVNFIVLFVAALLSYSLLRTLKFNRVVSILATLVVTIQPIYTLQMLTFMQDGFGFELLIIAVSSLALIIIKKGSHWPISVFLIAEIFLVSTKYSHLPVAFVLGVIFTIVIFNRILNKEFKFRKNVKYSILVILIVSSIFAYLPFVRNQIFHGFLFYPTNIPELMGSVRYNNIPLNLSNENKLNLLFYGIFSKSQPKESGDPRNEKNIAELKIPFTFTPTELLDAGGHFNNRVGAGGPLFSGIVTLSLLFLGLIAITARSRQERYGIYVSAFGLLVIVVLSLLAPTPNLLRYVNQLQLIPFVIAIPIYSTFKEHYVKFVSIIIFILVGLNTLLYTSVVIQKNISDTKNINQQFSEMKTSGIEHRVRAQQFFSNYIILKEQQVPFAITNRLSCKNIGQLYASSTTTQYCIN